uniref:Uncharacterized protein n=1 Tax=Physcomitrium patens TaxID=3218 RepID=A0A2K1KUN2_PHYPA|nr:hypothetical protein PHYPA_004472 [Physcomitrium patens]
MLLMLACFFVVIIIIIIILLCCLPSLSFLWARGLARSLSWLIALWNEEESRAWQASACVMCGWAGL